MIDELRKQADMIRRGFRIVTWETEIERDDDVLFVVARATIAPEDRASGTEAQVEDIDLFLEDGTRILDEFPPEVDDRLESEAWKALKSQDDNAWMWEGD